MSSAFSGIECGARSVKACCGCRYLDLGSYAEWDEDKRLDFLSRELEGKRPLIPPAMPMTDDVKEVHLWLSQHEKCAAQTA